jgi:hypothetical protein
VKRQGQSYVAAMLAVFAAFVALLATLPSVVPLATVADKVDTALLSVNETLKGCCAYASSEAWKVFYSGKIGGEGEATASATDRFLDCWSTSRDLVQGYYGLRVDGEPSFEHGGSTLTCKAELSVSKHGTASKLKWVKSIEMSIENGETAIKGDIPTKCLEINFTLKGVKPPYVQVEVYFLDMQGNNVYLTNALKLSFLPVSIEGDAFKYSVCVPIEPNYFARCNANKQACTLQYVVKASDDTGACVWVEGGVDLGGG